MQRSDAGFTLLEVLIAFAIFAMVLVAVYDSLSTSLRGGAAARQVQTMTEIARSVFSEVGRSIEMSEGEQSGRDGARAEWTLVILPASPSREDETSGRITRLFRLDLTLRDGEGGNHVFSEIRLGRVDD